MSRRMAKTVAVAVYPDGQEWTICRQPMGWNWRMNCWSSHYANAVENVEREGGHVERRPNPRYREPDAFEELFRNFRKASGARRSLPRKEDRHS